MSQKWRKQGIVVLVLAMGILLASPPQVQAQSNKDKGIKAKAIKHMVKGTAYLATLRIKPALREFHEAYKLFPLNKLPVLIAKCHGGINKAIFYYKMQILKNKGQLTKSFKDLLKVLIKMRPAPPQRKNKIVVKVEDIVYRNLNRNEKEQAALYDYLTNQLVSTGVWQVRPSDKVYQQVAKAKVQGHSDRMAEGTGPGIGFELPAKKLFRTTIAKIGKGCHVTLMVYDLKGATGENNGLGKGGCEEDEIVTSIDKAVAAVSRKY